MTTSWRSPRRWSRTSAAWPGGPGTRGTPLGLRNASVRDRWNVAEVVATSEPLIDTAARLIVAGAFDVRGVDLDETVARSRVLVATVASTLSVDASSVIVVPIDAANDEDATALGDAPRVTDLLRTVPMAGDTNAFDTTMAMLRDYFAAQAPAFEEANVPPSHAAHAESSDVVEVPAVRRLE